MKKKLCEIIDFSGCDNISPERQAELDAEIEALRATLPDFTSVKLSDIDSVEVKRRAARIRLELFLSLFRGLPKKFVCNPGMTVR